MSIAVLMLATIVYAQNALPRFEDFPTPTDWKGPTAALKLTTRSQRLFRTRLLKAAAEPPNYASHYRFVEWGCGSNCAAGAIVDLATGQVIAPPLATASDDFTVCSSAFDDSDVNFRLNSTLMIVRCETDFPDRMPDTYYFALEDQHFRQLAHLHGKAARLHH